MIFQVDDFLFDDECEYIKNRVIKTGLEESRIQGDALENEGLYPTLSDRLGELEFKSFDFDNDSIVNTSEVKIDYVLKFPSKMFAMKMYHDHLPCFIYMYIISWYLLFTQILRLFYFTHLIYSHPLESQFQT